MKLRDHGSSEIGSLNGGLVSYDRSSLFSRSPGHRFDQYLAISIMIRMSMRYHNGIEISRIDARREIVLTHLDLDLH